jgi:hypothetical protein
MGNEKLSIRLNFIAINLHWEALILIVNLVKIEVSLTYKFEKLVNTEI